MKNFLRALRFSWTYRWRFLTSVFCALMVAVFWGANLSAIYPVLNVLGTDMNLHQWIDKQINEYDRKIEIYQKNTEQLEKRLAQAEAMPAGKERDRTMASLTGQLAREETHLSSSRSNLFWSQKAKIFINKFCPQDKFETLIALLVLVFIGNLIKGVFDFWQESLVGSVVNLTIFDLRNSFYRHVIHQDVSQFSDQGTHQLMARFTNDMESLSSGLKALFGKVVAEPLKAFSCVAIACFISWRLTLLFLVIVPLALLLMSKVAIYMKRAGRRVLDSMSSIYKVLQESFQGIKVVKAFTMERHERRRLFEGGKDYYKQSMKIVKIDALSGPILEVVAITAVSGALLVGGYLVLKSETMIFGMKMFDQPPHWVTLLQLYALLVAIADPVRKLSNVYNKMQSAAAAADRIFDYMDRPTKVSPNVQGPRLKRHSQSIVLRDLCFSYKPDQPILTHLNLEVQFGETIAMVGKNGCGKSTLVGLINRFYDPDYGSILIDGLDIRQVNLRSLRSQIGLVTQETILFDETIAKNIAYGQRHATREQVEMAAKRAYAHDFIVKLKDGYETRVGEMGLSLSGGQRQRLCLARAILRDPSILILDEATSATDLESEALIHRTLKEFTKNRTTFLITHRLSTLEIADRIVVLDQGRIVAVGRHEQLMHQCDIYIRLYEVQLQRRVA